MKETNKFIKSELINCILTGIALALYIIVCIVRWFSWVDIVIASIWVIVFLRNIIQYFEERKYSAKKE
jgi:hypothetical protein